MIVNAPNRTEVLEIPPNVAEASRLLAKRLLPAKLDFGSKKNGQVFNTHLIEMGKAGLVLQMTGPQLAEELYKAIVQDVQSASPQLTWLVAPKALVKRAEQSKPTKVGDTREASNFVQKVREGEKVAAAQKIQDEAKKRCQELVGQFAPMNCRKGTLNFSLRDTHQAAWRKKIAEAKDFVKLEKEIATEQRTIYERLERAAERI